MPTECSAELFEFGTVEGRAVVAAFDGGAITSDAGALLLGATDRAIGLIGSVCGVLSRRAARGADRARGRDAGRPAGVRHRAGLRGPQRPRRAAPRSGDGGAGRQARGAARGLRAGGRQVDAQPAGAEPARSRRAITRSATIRRRSRALFVDLFLEAHERRPEADHSRSRCHRRSAARPAGGPLLPRLLRLLLLPAALRLLRPPPAGRQAAARQHRRRGRRGRGGGAHRRADPRALAAGRASCCAPTRALRARS